ncbi:aspartyl-trna synthetase [Mesorhizobium sanjuanii]|uniref:Aspartyl-trna synthetase n=1 Tax=Mesorhizobium sanjuanii TaxID=2037900 RepID=A0A2A6F9D4_9HYPH|nr:aspartyl-trna synthetase [Mesorhizobium sanjuanii]
MLNPGGLPFLRSTVKLLISWALIRFALTAALLAASATTTGLRAETTGLPLPRFVSLKSSPANLRIGPGVGYSVEWVYIRPGIPLEIYQQFGNWRRVRDWNGASGWIYAPLLSGHRTAVIAPWSKSNVALRKKPTFDSAVISWFEPGVGVKLRRCDGQWCSVALDSMSGFVKQFDLWGAYPGEVL